MRDIFVTAKRSQFVDRRQPLPYRIMEGWPVMHSELPYAKTSEVQFDFVPQKSGDEGAVPNAVTIT